MEPVVVAPVKVAPANVGPVVVAPVNVPYHPHYVHYEAVHGKLRLDEANIVILNIHKLQERLDKALVKRVPPHYFDLIIIDEAHHSTAPTWEKTLEYFSSAKVVKLTGTPLTTVTMKRCTQLIK